MECLSSRRIQMPSEPSTLLNGRAQRLRSLTPPLTLMHGLMSSQRIESSRLDVFGETTTLGDTGGSPFSCVGLESLCLVKQSGGSSDKLRCNVACLLGNPSELWGSSSSRYLPKAGERPKLLFLVQVGCENWASSVSSSPDSSRRSSRERLRGIVLRCTVLPASCMQPGSSDAKKSLQLMVS